MATLSPLAMPSAIRPRAISLTISPNSSKLTSTHSSPTLWMAAVRPACLRAASNARSAMVFDPVLASTAGMAATSKESPSSNSEGAILSGLSLCYLRIWLTLLVLQRRHEQGLVDPSLEDRHAHLHALADDFSAMHAGLACQFRGGQMDRHSALPPCGRFQHSRSFTGRSGRRQLFCRYLRLSGPGRRL